MANRLKAILRLLIAAPVCISIAACIVLVGRPVAKELNSADGVVVRSRARAHVKDGTTILYSSGFSVRGAFIRGSGVRYGLALNRIGRVDSISVDSIAAMESVTAKIDVASSVALTALGTGLLIAAGAAVATAATPTFNFGSCPTIYSDSAGTAVLEAESFSYSVAPLFETRDVDLLRARPDANGALRLEIRNEMLETHYINYLELLEVEHAPGEVVVPGSRGEFLLLNGLAPLSRAVDRTGRDVRKVLDAADGIAYESDSALLWNAAQADLRDFIDITHPVTAGTDSVVLLIRLRSSLLSTVIFYDVMLGAQGANAIDWVEEDLSRIGTALELGTWVRDNMGLSIRSRGPGSKGAWDVAKVYDPGPIAWKDIAVVVPVEQADSLRLRLDFVVDNWRIDRIAIAGRRRSAVPRRIKPSHYTSSDGARTMTPDAPLSAVDAKYLITRPSDRFFVHFNTGHAPSGEPGARQYSYLVAAHGYYIEWLRGSWIASEDPSPTFVPGAEALFTAVKGWREKKRDLEASFFNARIPVR